MAQVTGIDFTIKTSARHRAGTDTRVDIEIYRDEDLIERLSLEPGGTRRLNRGTQDTYRWTVSALGGVSVIVGGLIDPPFVSFPEGVSGHLRVRLVAKGDDAWRKDSVESVVVTGERRFVPGTIDAFEWVEERQRFFFGKDVLLSTGFFEGSTTQILIY
jgi:hypothetical protein